MALLHVIVSPEPVDPAFDAAASRALMLRVAKGEIPQTLRISRPSASVAFGRRDVVSAGYREAVEVARSCGFVATERLAGGRASVFHEGTLHIGLSVDDDDPRSGVTDRFEQGAAVIAEALSDVGVQDVRVGEVEGEYCPGPHSVNVAGERKLMGIGQRVVRNAAHVGMVLVASGEDRIRDVLVPTYEALSLSWRPETTGSVAAEVGDVGWHRVAECVVSGYRSRYEVVRAELDRETVEIARRLAPEHLS